MEKNECQTIVIDDDGNEVLKDKVQFKDKIDAMIKSKVVMLNKNVTDTLDVYKCGICNSYHIGRNGEKISDFDRKKYKHDLARLFKKRELERLKNFKPKIVGKIDLSTIPKR
jgi:hypothetical protein